MEFHIHNGDLDIRHHKNPKWDHHVFPILQFKQFGIPVTPIHTFKVPYIQVQYTEYVIQLI
jgi:hypothetical protein